MKFPFLPFIFIFLSQTVWASNGKFFRLELEGKVSYILATNHHAWTAALPSEIIEKIQTAGEIILEADAFTEPGDRERYNQVMSQTQIYLAERNHLGRVLSPGALRVYQKLFAPTGHLDVYLSMKPGIALVFAKEKYVEIVNEKIREHFFKASLEADLPIRIEYDLIRAAETLFEKPIHPHELKLAAFENIVHSLEESDKPEKGLDEMVWSEAGRLGKKTTYLIHTEPYQNKWLEYMNLVTPAEASQAIMAIDQALRQRTASHFFWDQMVAIYLSRKLDASYFAMENKTFGKTLDLITQATSNRNFPGEQRVLRYLSNRHRYWMATIMEKLKAGNVLIAVGAAHVVDMDHTTENTILAEFEKRGVKVEPIFLQSVVTRSKTPTFNGGRILCSAFHR